MPASVCPPWRESSTPIRPRRWRSRWRPKHASSRASRLPRPTMSPGRNGRPIDQPIESRDVMPLIAPSRSIPRNLTGQKALVTGANSGIGRAVAIALGEAGADVVVNFVSGDDAAAEVVKQIKGFAVAAYAHQADVSQEGDVQAMFAHMCAQFGTIDILVAN